MTKDEFVDEVSKLPGVGKKTAEALYAAGYKTMDALKGASVEDLAKLEGLNTKTAKAIVKGLHPEAEGEEADKVEVRESPKAKKTKGKAVKAEKAATEEKAEVVEPAAVYKPKIKAELSPELTRALQVRAERAAHEPAFRRYHWWYRKGMDPDVWRAPKGTLSKQRRGFKYRPPRVKIGYGKPAATRGLHPSGFEEVLVHNPDELTLVADPKTQAARIGGSVGLRKAKMIVEAAAQKGIRILNPPRRT